ncbi:unnamed protein product [Prorocentrum cordatum]|uniref:Uncharacterized protein n=1 Tax=Prorocentrum cordatum TaxID=2364126 RepID=A0ABN9U7F2_9DINO|nr:unnamed protein product [Polarella glacialis]
MSSRPPAAAFAAWPLAGYAAQGPAAGGPLGGTAAGGLAGGAVRRAPPPQRAPGGAAGGASTAAAAGALAVALAAAPRWLVGRGPRSGHRARRGAWGCEHRSSARRRLALRAAAPGTDAEVSSARRRAKDEDGGEVAVSEKDEGELDYVPTREELQAEEYALLKATGALEVQAKEEARREKLKWRKENPSPMDQWEIDMQEAANDLMRRRLYGDLKLGSKAHKRLRGKNVEEKETEIKYNRGFPVAETEESLRACALQEKKWMDQWRAMWPTMEAVDPHDPESFGFSFIGEISGVFGVRGEVRVRVDYDISRQGYVADRHLGHRNFSNWTEKPKRVHLKAPNRRFPRPFQIITGKRVQRDVYALQLAGVQTVEEARALSGFRVFALEPPPGIETEVNPAYGFDGEDLYDADTTTFHVNDALDLVGCKCLTFTSQVSEEVLADFAMAESREEAQQVLDDAGVEVVNFGELTGVIPDYRIQRRKRGRMQAHSILDITLSKEIVVGSCGYLYEHNPNSPEGKYFMANQDQSQYEKVTHVPFVPDMIARIDGGDDGIERAVYFSLPKDHIQRTTFTARKRLVDERGLLVSPRNPDARALLPPAGKSHALRRRDGKRLPLQISTTAPAPPEDMLQPAGKVFEEPKPGVPVPPMERTRASPNSVVTGRNPKRRMLGF